MKVNVKNKTDNAITVPWVTLVPGATLLVEQAAPDASASCVFHQPGNEPVQDAIAAWATAAQIAVEISFSPEPLPSLMPSPTPSTPPPFDPMNPLGI